MRHSSPSKPAPKGASDGNSHFVPEKLRAPAKGEELSVYRAYCASYEFYIQYLKALKKDFWSTTGATGLEYKVSIVADGQKDPMGRELDTEITAKKDMLFVKESGTPIPPPKKSKPSAPTPPLPQSVKTARRKAKNLRRSAARKARRQAAEVERLKQKTTLLKAKATYSQALQAAKPKGRTADSKSKGAPEKVSPKRKVKAAADTSVTAKDGKDGGGPGDSPSGPGNPAEASNSSTKPGPSSLPKGKGKEKESSQPKPPNRKERRKAIWGLPPSDKPVEAVSPSETGVGHGTTSAVKVVVPAPAKPAYAPFSFGDTSSSEDEKPVKPEVPAPVAPVVEPLKPAPFTFDSDSEAEKPKVTARIFPAPSESWQATSSDPQAQEVLTVRANLPAARARIGKGRGFMMADDASTVASATKLAPVSPVSRIPMKSAKDAAKPPKK